MAIALRSAGTGNNDVTVQTAEVSPPGTIVDGDILIMQVYVSDDVAISTPESGWTKIDEIQSNVGGDSALAIFRKIASGESGDYTVNIAGGFDKTILHQCSAYSGVNNSNIDDVLATKNGDLVNDDTPLAVPITTFTDNAMVITFIGAFAITGSGQAVPSGYTNGGFEHTTNHELRSAYKTITPADTENPGDWTGFGAGADSGVITIALRPDVGGTTALQTHNYQGMNRMNAGMRS